ncbi:BON domain-containing protein [Neisseriaceae bacterium ESL0693]|nr:BON domain-containing protein [Neisseriaceae bacterium ESL0693]
MKNYVSALLLGLALTASLNGCAALVVGGGATAGTLTATDRRTTGAQTDDQIMELRIKNSGLSYLNNQPLTNDIKPTLSVISYNRQILLLGLVNNEADKNQIERIARSQQAAQQVYNYIEVINQNRSLGHVTNDTWVTSKIRTNLLKAKGISSNHLKVVTFNGVTYAMGILTPAEQNIATEAISTTSGVQKVVTLYQTFEPVNLPQTGNQASAM